MLQGRQKPTMKLLEWRQNSGRRKMLPLDSRRQRSTEIGATPRGKAITEAGKNRLDSANNTRQAQGLGTECWTVMR